MNKKIFENRTKIERKIELSSSNNYQKGMNIVYMVHLEFCHRSI